MFCAQCGKEVSDGQTFCPFCGSRTTGSAEPSASGRARTPWEDREREGFFGGLAATVRGALFNPTEFFRKMSITGGLSDPLLYAMLTAVVGLMVNYVWQILFQDSLKAILPADGKGGAALPGLHGVGLAVFGMFIPFLVIIWIFLSAGMLHLLLLMVRGANGGFEATFRVVAYSCSTYLFMAVPFCGGMIAFVWSLIVSIIGLKEAHGTTGGKASFAVLFPYLLCCAAAVLIMVVVFGTIAASFSTMQTVPWK